LAQRTYFEINKYIFLSKTKKNMKHLFVVFLSVCLSTATYAQIINPKETIKQKGTDRVNSRIDQGIDKSLDKVEGLFKKKDKSTKNKKADGSTKSDGTSNTNTTDANTNASGNNSSQTPSFKTYSKFDFVSGEKVIAFDDFSTTSVGDFPLGWNTNSAAEIVTIEGNPNKWLFMSKDGFFMPEYVKDMPENFTLEFEMMNRYGSSNVLNYSFYLSAVDNPKKDLSNSYITNGIYFDWRPCSGGGGYIVYENSEKIIKNDGLNLKEFNKDDCSTPTFAKISIWRQKTRLRMYVNETKILDIPKAFDPKLKYNTFKFGTFYMNYATADNQDEFMVANVRYAVGTPDMRSKLITDGKLVTRGITFDVGSDKIKPESFGTLKEIAQVLNENTGVKVKIIGHTDSDGDANSNLELSKKRALAIKNTLTTEFKIDASRMETDGKGAAEPSEPNTTPQGKANNRRVEFIKL
jgi:OmpA-OmpF porin, OOP family